MHPEACVSRVWGHTAPEAHAHPHVERCARRYNTVMKLVFLGTSMSILYFMRFQRAVRATYDREQDTFRVAFLLVPCAVLALLVNQERSPLEVTPPADLACVRLPGPRQHSCPCLQALPKLCRMLTVGGAGCVSFSMRRTYE